MARILRIPLAALLVALAAAACTGRGRNAPRPVERTMVTVQNQSWLDMTMFVLYSSARQRLGTVSGNSQGTFRIPENMVGLGRSLRFMADPVGSSNTAQSFEIFVQPGDHVRLTIPATVR
jgi:hypothetical protein